jgi:hypothetical protein
MAPSSARRMAKSDQQLLNKKRASKRMLTVSSPPSPTTCRPYDHELAVALARNHREEAEKWLSEEEERCKLLYLKDGPQYVPFHCQKKDGTVPKAHLEDAFKEYHRRYGQSTAADKSPAVLLVATGVTTEWRVPEEVGCASFSLFPKLGAAKKSALFVTYMPGPEHGAVDSSFVEVLSFWRLSNHILKTSLSAGGLSSGGYGHFQPDKRLFPLKKYRDHTGQDSDGETKTILTLDSFGKLNTTIRIQSRLASVERRT